MVGQNADAETNLAEAAALAGATDDASALATSLAEAIEADRAAAAAAETRQTVAARTTAIAMAYARIARAIRLTILLAERLDRGWARTNTVDDRPTMAKRQIERGVKDAIAREAQGERADHLTSALTDRLETLDTEDEFDNLSPEQIIALICRDLGLDPARMTIRSPIPNAISVQHPNPPDPTASHASAPSKPSPPGPLARRVRARPIGADAPASTVTAAVRTPSPGTSQCPRPTPARPRSGGRWAPTACPSPALARSR